MVELIIVCTFGVLKNKFGKTSTYKVELCATLFRISCKIIEYTNIKFADIGVRGNQKKTMVQKEILNKKTGEKLIMFEEEDFEQEKPIKHYEEYFIFSRMILDGISKEELNGKIRPTIISKLSFIKASTLWRINLRKIKSVNIPSGFINIFSTTKKSEQEDQLKGLVLTPEILMGIMIKADELGYTLSQYTSEYTQKGVDLEKMPFAHEVKDDGKVKVFGKTELSDGQLKQAVEHRKVKIAKILEKGDEWHCFFVTYKSLRGEETWLSEKQPHYHYISSAFNIPKEEVIEQLKSETYKLGNLPHIKLEEYGKQPEV